MGSGLLMLPWNAHSVIQVLAPIPLLAVNWHVVLCGTPLDTMALRGCNGNEQAAGCRLRVRGRWPKRWAVRCRPSAGYGTRRIWLPPQPPATHGQLLMTVAQEEHCLVAKT